MTNWKMIASQLFLQFGLDKNNTVWEGHLFYQQQEEAETSFQQHILRCLAS